MYRKIENLEKKTARLRAELDELNRNTAAPANASAVPAGISWTLIVALIRTVLAIVYFLNSLYRRPEGECFIYMSHLNEMKEKLKDEMESAGVTDE